MLRKMIRPAVLQQSVGEVSDGGLKRICRTTIRKAGVYTRTSEATRSSMTHEGLIKCGGYALDQPGRTFRTLLDTSIESGLFAAD
jgi:hypothetical protein